MLQPGSEQQCDLGSGVGSIAAEFTNCCAARDRVLLPYIIA